MVGNHKLASINILSFIRFTHFNILLPVLKVGGSSPFGRASKKSLKLSITESLRLSFYFPIQEAATHRSRFASIKFIIDTSNAIRSSE